MPVRGTPQYDTWLRNYKRRLQDNKSRQHFLRPQTSELFAVQRPSKPFDAYIQPWVQNAALWPALTQGQVQLILFRARSGYKVDELKFRTLYQIDLRKTRAFLKRFLTNPKHLKFNFQRLHAFRRVSKNPLLKSMTELSAYSPANFKRTYGVALQDVF